MSSIEASPNARSERNADRRKTARRLQTTFGRHPLVTATVKELFSEHGVTHESLTVESAHSLPVFPPDQLETFFGSIDDGIAHYLDREKTKQEPNRSASIAATIGIQAIWLDHIGLARQRGMGKMRDSSRAGVDDHIQYLVSNVIPDTIATFPGPDVAKYKNYLNAALSNKLADRIRNESRNPSITTDLQSLDHSSITASDDVDLERVLCRETLLKTIRDAELSDKQVIHLCLTAGLDPRLLGVAIKQDGPILPYIQALPEAGYSKEDIVTIVGYRNVGVERVAKGRALAKVRRSLKPQE